MHYYNTSTASVLYGFNIYDERHAFLSRQAP